MRLKFESANSRPEYVCIVRFPTGRVRLKVEIHVHVVGLDIHS